MKTWQHVVVYYFVDSMHMARSGSIKEGNRHQEAPMLDDHARLSRVGVNVARITGPAKPQPKTSNHRTDPFSGRDGTVNIRSPRSIDNLSSRLWHHHDIQPSVYGGTGNICRQFK